MAILKDEFMEIRIGYENYNGADIEFSIEILANGEPFINPKLWRPGTIKDNRLIFNPCTEENYLVKFFSSLLVTKEECVIASLEPPEIIIRGNNYESFTQKKRKDLEGKTVVIKNGENYQNMDYAAFLSSCKSSYEEIFLEIEISCEFFLVNKFGGLPYNPVTIHFQTNFDEIRKLLSDLEIEFEVFKQIHNIGNES